MDGATPGEIHKMPEKYGICDGWMVSFATDETHISNNSFLNTIAGKDRKAISTSLTSDQYDQLLHLRAYSGEEPMIPQEFFAIFLLDLYQKYSKTNKTLANADSELLGSQEDTWFISTRRIGFSDMLFAGWSGYVGLNCGESRPDYFDNNLGIRTVVRRKPRY